MAYLLKGNAVAANITEDLTKRAVRLKNAGIIPKLAILSTNRNTDALSYEKAAKNRCQKIGIETVSYDLDKNFNPNTLYDIIDEINADKSVHGLLMLRPLKDKAVEKKAISLLNVEKDADSMTEKSLSSVFFNSDEGFAPCTAEACIEILKYYDIPVSGKHAVVIGRSDVVGKPVSMLLLKMDATVTICHSKTQNLREICRTADIIVVAAGKAEILDESFFSENQIVIDVGINENSEGKICGDVCFDRVFPIVKAITPVPGGVGAVTTSILASHVISTAEAIHETELTGN